MLDPVNPKPNFPELEAAVLKFWKENKIFEKQVESKPEDNKFVFYDGPPFITGLPHYGHLLGSIAKDVIPRYQAMKGKRVERIWGWDCHGLPIENKVEKELELKNRRDIEKLGIDKFIEHCYKYTRETSAEWNWYIDRIGRWADMDKAYRTMDQDYMESVMWVFKQLYDKDLIYEGTRTSLYCTRCGTPVSNFEIAMDNSYTDMIDPTVTAKFKLKNPPVKGDIGGSNTYLLAWTTTPWTLPSNRALVVDKDGDYVLVKREMKLEDVKGVGIYLYNPKKDQFALTSWDGFDVLDINTLPGLRLIESATDQEAIEHLITKKLGYKNFKPAVEIGNTKSQWPYKDNAIMNGNYNIYFVELENADQQKRELEDWEKFDIKWTDADKLIESLSFQDQIEHGKVALGLTSNREEIKETNWVTNDKITDSDFTEYLIMGKERVEEVMSQGDHVEGQSAEYEIVEEFKGEKLIGAEYEPLFDFIPGNENDFKVYHYDGMVSADEGVGVVHSAPGFGEIDSQMGKELGLTMMFTIDDEGKFKSEISDYAGMYYKEANKYIFIDLTYRNLIFANDKIIHRYPYCYRCETPLIQRAQPQWYIDVQNQKEKLLANNEKVNWIPAHLKDGRFGKGLQDAPDWGISRTRYWGTPMPVWQSKDEDPANETSGNVIERVVIGSRDELMEKNNEITKVIFVRHGKYDKKAGSPQSGNVLDGSLNNKGKIQAQNLVEKFKTEKILNFTKVDVILSSSMKRCPETIKPLADELGLEVKIDERFGSLSRKEDLYAKKEEYKIEKIKHANESVIQEIYKDTFETDRKTAEQINEEYKGKTIVVCTHGEVISSFKSILEGGKFTDDQKKELKCTGIVVMYLYKGKLLDLHRPVIDDIVLQGKSGPLHRVDETLDVWMESASMPYAQKHYPFENKEDVENNFPADYIAEYIAQTRAWFYVMHVISTSLMDSNSFKNVVTTGVIGGNDGRKMSKSYGNYPDPKGVMNTYGGDALRMYLMNSPLLNGENIFVDEKDIKGQLREFLLPLWNIYSFFLTYANIHNWTPSNIDTQPNVDHGLDIWILSLFNKFVRDTRDDLDHYLIPSATRRLPEFLNDLSKWYIRRSRDRFRDGDPNALSTLHYILKEFSKVAASFTPFVAENMYRNLVNLEENPESVHLCDFPLENMEFLEKNGHLLFDMQTVRTICNIGQSIRAENGFKVRQPLSTIEITVDREEGDLNEITEWMKEIIIDELNIKEVVELKEKDKHSTGGKFITIDDTKARIKITVNTEITEELKQEGIYRELVRNIQSFRKKKGLQLGEMVDMQISTEDQELTEIMKKFMDELKNDINAKNLEISNELENSEEVKVNQSIIKINLN